MTKEWRPSTQRAIHLGIAGSVGLAVLGLLLLFWAIREPEGRGVWDVIGSILCSAVALIASSEVKRSFLRGRLPIVQGQSTKTSKERAGRRRRGARYYVLCALTGLGFIGGMLVLVMSSLQSEATPSTFAFGLLMAALSVLTFFQVRRRFIPHRISGG